VSGGAPKVFQGSTGSSPLENEPAESSEVVAKTMCIEAKCFQVHKIRRDIAILHTECKYVP
jgi:hypothetical protein